MESWIVKRGGRSIFYAAGKGYSSHFFGRRYKFFGFVKEEIGFLKEPMEKEAPG